KYAIRVRDDEDSGPAAIKLEWGSTSQARQVIPKDWLYSGDAASADDNAGLVDSSLIDSNGVLRQTAVWHNGATGQPMSISQLDETLGNSAAVSFKIRTTQTGNDDPSLAPNIA